MQKLKKLAALALAMMLTAASALSASADTATVKDKNGSKTIDVNAKYAGGALTPDVYSVDVTWGKMEFTYSVSGTREWDPVTHEYADKTTAGWVADGNGITVVNHSNVDVTVDFAYAAAEGYSDITGTFNVTSDTLDAGVAGNVKGADSVSTYLTLSGSLASSDSAFTKVGSVTVSLS